MLRPRTVLSPSAVVLPAWSLNSGLLAVRFAPSVLTVTVRSARPTRPEVTSEPWKVTSTGLVYQPLSPAVPATSAATGVATAGAVASRLTDTSTAVAVPPLLLASQRYVVAAWSALIVRSSQPVTVAVDSLSVTVQSRTTSPLLYQPLAPLATAGFSV